MKTEQRQTLKGIMDSVEGATLKEKHGGQFHFNLHLTDQMKNTPIEALELKPRAYNCLKRAGLCTIGELAYEICEGDGLKYIRNCGARSIREIMEQLFLFQYSSLSPQKREAYLEEVVQINSRKHSHT